MKHFKSSEKTSTYNFLSRGLGDEGRACESSCRGSIINLIDKRFVERDIDSYRPTGIGEQRNGKQHCPRFEGFFDIRVTQNAVNDPGGRQRSPGAFKRLRMLTKGHSRVRDSLFQSIAGGEASLNVRKPDSEGAIYILLDDSYVMRRHRPATLLDNCSRPPARQLVNSPYESERQILSRMRDGDNHIVLRMFERVMIPVDPIENPSVLLQHSNQFAAVPFHLTHRVESSGRTLPSILCSIWQALLLLPFRAGKTSSIHPDRVYKYTHK